MSDPTACISEDKCLDILHDHYKETFARVLLMERARDRQFLWVILLFALLFLEVGYPAEFRDTISEVKAFEVKLAIDSLPLPALLNATWVFTFAVVLSYCRKAIWVNRNYRYVHDLEGVISPMINKGNIYRREGLYYEEEYPVLLDVSWVAYAFVFPLILLFAVLGLLHLEKYNLQYPGPNRLFDILMGAAIILAVFFYQFQPLLSNRIQKLNHKRTHRSNESDDLMLP